MTARYEVCRTVLFGDICEFKDDAHHACVNPSIIEAVPER